MKKTIIVTGAVGFLGTNLCLKLLDQGHNVIGIDNFSTGQSSNYNILNEHNNFSLYAIDLHKDAYCIFQQVEYNIDEIYYLASPASPPKYQERKLETIFVNTYGLHVYLKFAETLKIPLLFSSTSEVYGDPLVHPQTEEYWGNVNSFGPRSCYDEAKRLGETICRAYIERGNDVKIARIFNTYGPYMDISDGRVITNFINQAMKGAPLTIYGSGEQTRSFCYVRDLIEGLIGLMNSSCTSPVNLGNPDEYKIIDIAKTINTIIQPGRELSFVMGPLPQDDPQRRRPDINKAKRIMGWKPVVPLNYGLEQTIEHFRGFKNRGLTVIPNNPKLPHEDCVSPGERSQWKR
jgi:UDP-glucuronate decarboxylase